MEALELLYKIWTGLTGEQKRGVLLLATSLPLGLFSIGVGLYSADYLMVFIGLATLAVGLYTLTYCGFILLKILLSLVKFLLKLPFILILLIKNSILGRGKQEVAEDGDINEGESNLSRKEPPQHKASSDSLSRLDVISAVWVLLAVFQIYKLLQLL